MLKILHITSSYMPKKIAGDLNYSKTTNDNEGEYSGARVGGLSSSIESFCENLPMFEHHILLSQGQRFQYGEWCGRINVEERNGLFIHYFPNSGDITYCKDVQYTFQGLLEKEYEDFNFDVIITHVVQPNMDLSNINKKCKWINFTHGSPTNNDLSDEYMDLIDTNLLYTEWQKTRLKDNSKSVVIPFPVDTNIFYPRNNAPSNDFVWHGRISPEKRIIDFAVKFEDEIDSELNIIGGPDSRAWMDDIVHSDLDKVKFLGRQFDETLAEILSSHNFYVLMSEYETYCIALVEALASGCSVYAIYHPSLEWAKDVVNFVETMDDLVEAIKSPVVSNSVSWVEKNYSWNKLGQAYYELLNMTKP